MNTSRRELSWLLPVLLAGAARAEEEKADELASACYPFDKLPVNKNAKNGNEIRQVFSGETHEGCPVDLHITTLQPGQMPHPAHTHVHEEMIVMEAGTLEVTISGKSTRIGPGSVAVVKSQELHGWKNVGDAPATYFVLALGHKQAG